MHRGWIHLGLMLAAMPLGAAEEGGNAAAGPSASQPPAEEKKSAYKARASKEAPSALMEDPLEREKLKLDRDLWITKGIQGGFKTDDLWILQPPGGGASAASSQDTGGDASKGWPDWRDKWSGALEGAERGAAAEQADLQRAERARQWEKFVFGEKKVDSKSSDGSWRQPLLSGDNEPAPGVRKAPEWGGFGVASDPLVGGTVPSPATGLPGFGLPQTPSTHAERNPAVSDAAQAAGLPFTGAGFHPPGMVFEPAGALPQVPGAEPFRPAVSGPSHFGLQPPGMPSMGFPDNPAAGVQKGPQLAPRAHSTDSFMPPRQW